MKEKILIYLAELKKKSTAELFSGLSGLLKSERTTNVKLIAHLAEIQDRKAHIDLGFPSMFAYCEGQLKLDPGIIWQRLQVAAKCRAFPELLVALYEGNITLSVAGKICAHLTAENVVKILQDCMGKSSRAVDEYLTSLKPKPVFQSSVRKQPMTLFAAETAQPAVVPTAVTPQTIVQPATPEVFNFRFSGSKVLKRKLDRLGELLGLSPNQAMEQMIDYALECALDRKDPIRKEQRLEKRQAKAQPKARLAEKKSLPGRYVPAKDRAAALKKSGYQCEFTSPAGVRCPAKTKLEIDHIHPIGMGGASEPGNEQVLCKAHNLRKAERDYGREYIAAKRGAASAGGVCLFSRHLEGGNDLHNSRSYAGG